jgi:hypothetical protein
MCERLLDHERQVVRLVRDHWVYKNYRPKSGTIKLYDIVIDGGTGSHTLIRNKQHNFAHDFRGFTYSYADFVDNNKNYKIKTVRFDDIVYIRDNSSNLISGGLVLKDGALFGLFDVMNWFSETCSGEWSFHFKVFHFADKDDLTLFDLMDYSTLVPD